MHALKLDERMSPKQGNRGSNALLTHGVGSSPISIRRGIERSNPVDERATKANKCVTFALDDEYTIGVRAACGTQSTTT